MRRDELNFANAFIGHNDALFDFVDLPLYLAQFGDGFFAAAFAQARHLDARFLNLPLQARYLGFQRADFPFDTGFFAQDLLQARLGCQPLVQQGFYPCPLSVDRDKLVSERSNARGRPGNLALDLPDPFAHLCGLLPIPGQARGEQAALIADDLGLFTACTFFGEQVRRKAEARLAVAFSQQTHPPCAEFCNLAA